MQVGNIFLFAGHDLVRYLRYLLANSLGPPKESTLAGISFALVLSSVPSRTINCTGIAPVRCQQLSEIEKQPKNCLSSIYIPWNASLRKLLVENEECRNCFQMSLSKTAYPSPSKY